MEHALDSSLNISENIEFTIEKGDTLYHIMYEWQEKKYIQDIFWLKLWIKLKGHKQNIKLGTYDISPDLSIKQIVVLFFQGQEKQYEFTIIEGTTLDDIFNEFTLHASRLNLEITSEKALLDLLELPYENAEGWLYPDTYLYTKGMSNKSIILRAFQKMNMVLQQQWQQYSGDSVLKSAYHLLILASIIEKEAYYIEEKKDIASVFMNRLRINMRLQADPTIIYGLKDNFDGNITKKHLRSMKNRYNTYRISGLPPTPICMPAKTSIEAAAQSNDTEFYYFVLDEKNRHYFSKTLNEHNKAVRRYIKKER